MDSKINILSFLYALKSLSNKISGRYLRKIIYKYNKSGRVGGKRRTCHKQRLITINRSLLSLNQHLQINSQHTLKKVKQELVLTA